MPTITGEQIRDMSVCRVDLNTTTAGKAVITKVVQGTGITITSTGQDSGTGDVTINHSSTLTHIPSGGATGNYLG